MNYKKLMNEVQLKKSVDFKFKKEKFRLSIDWENDLCLTHYSESLYE